MISQDTSFYFINKKKISQKLDISPLITIKNNKNNKKNYNKKQKKKKILHINNNKI
jgi:hypothetical protein